MKNKLISLIAALIPVFLFAQIPNNSFENWTSMGNYNNPDEWSTLNDMTASANVYTCVKGSPGSPGQFYIKLVSKSVSGMGLKPGIAVSGDLNILSMQPSGGFSYSGKALSLDGKWQYMANGNDQGYISIFLSRWNSDLMSRDTISYTYYALPGMAMSWANFSIPLESMSELTPDTAMIVLSASNANGAATVSNSYLYIDNLSFTESTVGIDEVSNSKIINVYPNPVKTILHFNYPAPREIVTLNIFDSKGSLVLQKENYQIFDNSYIDTGTLKPGLFTIIVKSDSYVATSNFIKE